MALRKLGLVALGGASLSTTGYYFSTGAHWKIHSTKIYGWGLTLGNNLNEELCEEGRQKLKVYQQMCRPDEKVRLDIRYKNANSFRWSPVEHYYEEPKDISQDDSPSS